jgi:hypothetical protein
VTVARMFCSILAAVPPLYDVSLALRFDMRGIMCGISELC